MTRRVRHSRDQLETGGMAVERKELPPCEMTIIVRNDCPLETVPTKQVMTTIALTVGTLHEGPVGGGHEFSIDGLVKINDVNKNRHKALISKPFRHF